MDDLRRQSWVRYLMLVLSVLDLLSFPIGAYSIWALLQDETAQLFDFQFTQQAV